MPPVEIDGNPITGATIDGTDVQEITVDGDVVFSAAPTINFPVAYSNLVAWYPFDSATYGGSNADDVTAILGGSGDDTAYDGTVNGATYDANGGVTDISAGANSGAFEFDGSNDSIAIDNSLGTLLPFTIMYWIFSDTYNKGGVGMEDSSFDEMSSLRHETFEEFRFFSRGNNGDFQVTAPWTINQFQHVAGVDDGSQIKIYVDGNLEATDTSGGSKSAVDNFIGRTADPEFSDAIIEDVRFYDTDLSGSQINQIYNNTKP